MEKWKSPLVRATKAFSGNCPCGIENEQFRENPVPPIFPTTPLKQGVLIVKTSGTFSGIKHSTKITEKYDVKIVECG